MTYPSVWRAVLPPIVADGLASVRRRVRARPPAVEPDRVVPWSPPYHAHKERVIARAIADPAQLEAFRLRQPLPAGYGFGVDERCIEYPWLVSQLSPGRETLLDAGSILNHEPILRLPVFRAKEICILTLAPESACFWQLGVGYLFSDLRDVPLRDEFFDTVVCVSTLEHVGCDNSYYGTARPSRAHVGGDFRTALRELRRVLRVGGTLLLTVPFGREQQFPEFRQFDRQLLDDVRGAFGSASSIVETFYRYSERGWQIANAEECGGCEYVEWITRLRTAWPDPMPIESDWAAAARAVACVRLVKQ